MIAFLLCGLLLAGQQTTAGADITLAAGELGHHTIGTELFRIDELWIRVADNTEFHRWLSQGIGRRIAIVLTTNRARLVDEKDTRILTGKMIHETAPNPTSNAVHVVGQLPPGNLPMVHVVFLRDEITGTFGAVTLETTDQVTASKFDGLDNALVSIVIRISDG